ncbi:PE domain-containing protein [Mycobacterium hackensackense]|uniref:PE family protein n=1 Tax=Mycobacterium hackensackense TaxID=228909 RepID=UPI0022659A4A|nr:PE family protein [Mycobacterium hackensackense]MCV7256920.1 PE domain-containing protein [Mycobacterium hackensackense]
MGNIVFDPDALRRGAGTLMTLAAQLRSDPGARDAVVADVVAQLRELAADRVSATQVALGNAADTFEANAAVTPESIEDFARRLQAVAANQDAAIASANARFTF